MSDSQPIVLYIAVASAAAYYMYTRGQAPSSERLTFLNPAKDYNAYDASLVISSYDYSNNKNAYADWWHNQYQRKDGRFSNPPA